MVWGGQLTPGGKSAAESSIAPLKPSKRNPQGGRLSKEMAVAVSNVALIDPQTNTPTRVGVRFTADGTKELYAKKSGALIRVLAKANPKYAKK